MGVAMRNGDHTGYQAFFLREHLFCRAFSARAFLKRLTQACIARSRNYKCFTAKRLYQATL